MLAVAGVFSTFPVYAQLSETPVSYDSTFIRPTSGYLPDSLAVLPIDSLAIDTTLIMEVPTLPISIDPAYYKLYLPVTVFQGAVMQWAPSRLLKGKYDQPKQTFLRIYQQILSDSIQAEAIRKKEKLIASLPPHKRNAALKTLAAQKDEASKDTTTIQDTPIHLEELQKAARRIWQAARHTSAPSLSYDRSLFTHFAESDGMMNRSLYALYMSNPGAIEKWEYQINELKIYKVEKAELTQPKVGIAELFRPDPISTEIEEKPESDLTLVRPSLWRFHGNGSLQFTQLHFSGNWYKGGENNMNLQSNLEFNFNYDNREYVQWDNRIEIREGINTTPSDTEHSYKMSSDLFRLNSKIGLRAIKYWYYTFETTFSSQFFTAYETNSNKKISSLLSPGTLSASIGMDFKLNKKKFNISAFIGPLAYELRFIKDREIDETRYGIDRGKFSQHTYGSRIKSTWEWKILSYLTYRSYLEWFTNYERVEFNWENTIDFIINKHLKTSFFSHIRFDDNVRRKEGDSYFQFKDQFNFGISYSW